VQTRRLLPRRLAEAHDHAELIGLTRNVKAKNATRAAITTAIRNRNEPGSRCRPA
jgi:hypothetical protein